MSLFRNPIPVNGFIGMFGLILVHISHIMVICSIIMIRMWKLWFIMKLGILIDSYVKLKSNKFYKN